jgi:regulator of sigma E protease
VNQFYSPFFQDIQRQIRASAKMTIALHVIRDGQAVNLRIPVTHQGTIGFIPKSPTAFFKKEVHTYTLAQAIPGGFHQAWETVTDYTSQLRFLFSKSGAQQVGGFVTFAKLFPEKWDWWAFWERTAFISLVLAFMNILPIPALDGGHVMFLIWEMITGKAVSQKILERAQFIGMMLLLGLMLYGNGMDIFRVVTGQ